MNSRKRWRRGGGVERRRTERWRTVPSRSSSYSSSGRLVEVPCSLSAALLPRALPRCRIAFEEAELRL